MSPSEGPSSRPRPGGGSRSGKPTGGGGRGGPAGGGRPGGSGGRDRPAAPGDRSGRPGRPSGGTGGGRPDRAGERGGRPGAPARGRPAPDGEVDENGRPAAGPKQWGSLGRRGAARLRDVDARDSIGATDRDLRPKPDFEPERWERVDDVRDEAAGAVDRGRRGPARGAGARRPAAKDGGGSKDGGRRDGTGRTAAEGGGARGGPKAGEPKERRGRAFRSAGAGTGGAAAKDELVRALGGPRGARANERLREAAHAFERERFEETRTLLKPIAEQAPQASAVRELLGLAYYRLGRWKDAVRELEAFRANTGSTEQHPVLADAYRGLKRHGEVETLWDELRESSPSGDLVTEGRIVMAGSLADRKQLREAIALLEKAQRSVKRPQLHHVRQAYALADLYERAGDLARARELFRWVVDHEPGFVDAAERASSLG